MSAGMLTGQSFKTKVNEYASSVDNNMGYAVSCCGVHFGHQLHLLKSLVYSYAFLFVWCVPVVVLLVGYTVPGNETISLTDTPN